MRPTKSNIGTATYEIANYLNMLPTPFSKSKSNILNTETLLGNLENK